MSTIYETASGKIVISRELTEVQENTILNRKPGLALLPFTVANPALMRINRVTLDAELIVPKINAVDYAREQRAYLLANCDWTQAVDSPLSEIAKASWATYRQELRDMTVDLDPELTASEIVWPTPP